MVKSILLEPRNGAGGPGGQEMEAARQDARHVRQGLDQERALRESLEQEAARNVEEPPPKNWSKKQIG